jgi:hypothetical protein
MKFAAILFLIANASFASVQKYDLNMELSLDGKKVMAPKMIVLDCKSASISEQKKGDGSFLDVIATENTGKGILMKFKVGRLENGMRRVLGEPSIIALDGQPAKIEMSNVSLFVTAKKLAN